MNILFIILLLICAWHFVVQAIFIPNQAHDSKYKLYELRDNLRRLYIEGKIEKIEFQNLDDFATKAIKLYKFVTFYDIIFNKTPNGKSESKSNKQLDSIFNCQNEDYIQIRNKMFAISFKNAFHNSLGWLPYIIVPAVIYFLYVLLMHKRHETKERLRNKSNFVVISGGNLTTGSYC